MKNGVDGDGGKLSMGVWWHVLAFSGSLWGVGAAERQSMLWPSMFSTSILLGQVLAGRWRGTRGKRAGNGSTGA